jgi:hypothetical protein
VKVPDNGASAIGGADVQISVVVRTVADAGGTYNAGAFPATGKALSGSKEYFGFNVRFNSNGTTL